MHAIYRTKNEQIVFTRNPLQSDLECHVLYEITVLSATRHRWIHLNPS